MKKKSVLIGLIVIMVTYVFIATYFWRELFLDLGTNGELGGLQNINNALILKDQNNIHVVYNEISDINSVEGYRFNVENKGVSSQEYRLILKELSANEVNDGCSESTLLDAKDLNYQLYVNGSLMQKGNLQDIVNKSLYKRKINIDVTDKYELKVWLKERNSDSEGKHYHYRVDLEVIK